jgi:hypothetical protein
MCWTASWSLSRHLKATDPDVRAIKRDCARAVYSYYGFAKAAWPGDAKRLRVFPKVLCMGHFFVDTAMFGGAHGFSAYAWESPQGLFSRKAFERSSGRYGEECAVRRPRRPVDRGNPGSTARVRFTLRGILPMVRVQATAACVWPHSCVTGCAALVCGAVWCVAAQVHQRDRATAVYGNEPVPTSPRPRADLAQQCRSPLRPHAEDRVCGVLQHDSWARGQGVR